MPARTAALKVKIELGDSISPEHTKYHTSNLECCTPGFNPTHGHRKEGVRVYLGEWDWEHSAVYLAIDSRYRLQNGVIAEGCFEEPIGLEQLDQIIDGLVKVRDKAREMGILTPRAIPNTTNSIGTERKAS